MIRPPPGGEGSRTKEERMADKSTEDIMRRLKSVEGHVRGIGRMLEEGAYCVDVVNQIVAVQRALKKVSTLVLDRHLHSCVTRAIQGDDAQSRERVLEELLEVFEANARA